MNALASSECSSGCESGWTLYLEKDHSFLNRNASQSHRSSLQFIGGFYDQNTRKKFNKEDSKEDSEEEDLSMVSDASSGPPLHFPQDKKEKVANRSKKRQKVNLENQQQHLPSFLDDTASSPLFHISMNNVTVTTKRQSSTESMLDYSQGFSATYVEERSSLQDHLDFLQPSLSDNEVHKNNGWYDGKEMELI